MFQTFPWSSITFLLPSLEQRYTDLFPIMMIVTAGTDARNRIVAVMIISDKIQALPIASGPIEDKSGKLSSAPI